FAEKVNAICIERQAPVRVAHFGSLFKIQMQQDLAWGELLFAALRYRGVHIWDHRPCLLTVAHTDEDVDAVVAAFREALIELQQAGFLPGLGSVSAADESATPPPSHAKLGKDANGKPAWFIPDSDNPGKYLQVAAPQS
ncbi:MAG: hypothetical protein AAGF97_19575, partial [Planctomycetota bacterium]